MRYCNAFIIMMILVSAVYADITFLRIYEAEIDYVTPCDIIEVTGGGYAFTNHAFDWHFLRTDEYGEVLVQNNAFWGFCLCENQDIELVTAQNLYAGGDYGVRFVWADNMGNILRTRDYFEIECENPYPHCIIQTSDKGYIICGTTYVDPFVAGFVMKLDSLENYQWHIELSDAYLYSIVEDDENCFLACGYTLTDYVIKISQDGNIIWENTYPYSSTFYGAFGIVQTSSGYVFASQSRRIVGISSSGSFQWQYESEVLEAGYWDVCVATNGDIVACGYDDDESGVLTRLDHYGNLIWEKEYENCQLLHINGTADSGFVSTGRYIFDSPDDNDCLLLKVDPEGNYIELEPMSIETEPENNDLQLFPVYPNPVTESATISYCLTEPVAVMISVFEVSGRLISFPVDCISDAGTYSFEMNDLPSGMYMVRMKAGEHELVQRFVVIN